MIVSKVIFTVVFFLFNTRTSYQTFQSSKFISEELLSSDQLSSDFLKSLNDEVLKFTKDHFSNWTSLVTEVENLVEALNKGDTAAEELLKKNLENGVLTKQLLELMNKKFIERHCVTHVSAQGFLTSFLVSAFLSAARANKGTNALVDDAIYKVGREGNSDTFRCTPEKYRLTEFAILKEDGALLSTAKVEARPGNVIIGVKFTVLKNTLFVQLEEGKLYPFGIAKRLQRIDLDVMKKLEKPTKKHERITEDCKFVLNSVQFPPDHVLTAVQLEKRNSEKGCEISVKAYAKQADLLKGEFIGDEVSMDYKALDSSIPEKGNSGLNATQMEEYITSTSNYSIAVEIARISGGNFAPYIDTQKVRTFPAFANSGLDVYLTHQPEHHGYIHLTLHSVNMTKYVEGIFFDPKKTYNKYFN